jgi:hypothetical protein
LSGQDVLVIQNVQLDIPLHLVPKLTVLGSFLPLPLRHNDMSMMSEVLTAVTILMLVIWVVTPCGLVGR